jgi:dUTP pyrophosphatase
MKVKMKRLHERAELPRKVYSGDAAFDFTAVEEEIDTQTGMLTYKLGWAIEIPPGYVGLFYPRSSIANKDIVLSNSVGVIDENYRGELMAKFKPLRPAKARKYDVGERVVQLIIMPIPQIELTVVDELSNTERGTGSYGSTGA